jgi:hypothetical protein
MELNINELDNYDFTKTLVNNNISSNELHYMAPKNSHSYEEIPENTFPKKKVHFNQQIKPIPKTNAKMVRPQGIQAKPQISYDDILTKMGMFVVNGKLHLIEDNNKLKQQLINNQTNKSPIMNQNMNQNNYNKSPVMNQNMNQNNYIYNKYFKDELQQEENVKRPMTLMEYRRKLIIDVLQKKRINQIKSTKLLFPTSNINISGGSRNPQEMNKLFNFSKK